MVLLESDCTCEGYCCGGKEGDVWEGWDDEDWGGRGRMMMSGKYKGGGGKGDKGSGGEILPVDTT